MPRFVELMPATEGRTLCRDPTDEPFGRESAGAPLREKEGGITATAPWDAPEAVRGEGMISCLLLPSVGLEVMPEGREDTPGAAENCFEKERPLR